MFHIKLYDEVQLSFRNFNISYCSNNIVVTNVICKLRSSCIFARSIGYNQVNKRWFFRLGLMGLGRDLVSQSKLLSQIQPVITDYHWQLKVSYSITTKDNIFYLISFWRPQDQEPSLSLDIAYGHFAMSMLSDILCSTVFHPVFLNAQRENRCL